MMDGNFKLINLEKKNNKDDESLWDGRGYFRARKEADAHMEKHYDLKVEVRHLRSLYVEGNWLIRCRKGTVRSSQRSRIGIP